MTKSQFAQLNIAKMRFPLDKPEVADFVNSLERINNWQINLQDLSGGCKPKMEMPPVSITLATTLS